MPPGVRLSHVFAFAAVFCCPTPLRPSWLPAAPADAHATPSSMPGAFSRFTPPVAPARLPVSSAADFLPAASRRRSRRAWQHAMPITLSAAPDSHMKARLHFSRHSPTPAEAEFLLFLSDITVFSLAKDDLLLFTFCSLG